MVRYWKIGLSVVVFFGVSIFGFSTYENRADAGNSLKTNATAPILVKVGAIKNDDIPNTVTALGSLSAAQVVTVSAESPGRISAINFKNGQQVAEGMPIVQLDNQKDQANYQVAVTALNLSRTKYNRSKLLVNTAISKEELSQLKADMDSKHSDVKSALAALNQKQITAPFSGVLGAFKVNVGDYVHAGDKIVNLVNTSQLLANYNLPETLLPELQQNQLVKISVDAYPHKVFFGTVNYISPTINQDTRTVSLQASVPNDKGLLSPGMFVHISQQVSVVKNALVVPEEAVMVDVKGYYVFKVLGNKVSQTYITLGNRYKNEAQVLSGLKLGDKVIIAGQQKLNDGSVIKTI